jgi:hypothetical protein
MHAFNAFFYYFFTFKVQSTIPPVLLDSSFGNKPVGANVSRMRKVAVFAKNPPSPITKFGGEWKR